MHEKQIYAKKLILIDIYRYVMPAAILTIAYIEMKMVLLLF